MLGPDPSKVRATPHVHLSHEGVHRTQFFFSFSGGLLVEGDFSALVTNLDGQELEIAPPLRLAHSSFRPTPQLTFDTVSRFYNVAIPTPFPLQVATFPGNSNVQGATADCWFGPSATLPPGAPPLPRDTFLVTLHGEHSANRHERIERYFLAPLLDWLRVLTRQWWIGRSTEGAGGPLHFIAPLAEDGSVVGSPTPVARFTTAGVGMMALTNEIWMEAGRRACSGRRPPGARILEMDANFMLASKEFRSGIILACSAVEAARDTLLARAGARISHLGTSKTDLLKHLSVGFARRFERSLAQEEPELFELLKAFWSARGQAAHGKPVRWRTKQAEEPIEEIEFGVHADGLARILDWIGRISSEAVGDPA